LADLEAITVSDHGVIPVGVTDELLRGITSYPALGTVTSLSWLHAVDLEEVEEIVAFAKYKAELGCGPERNEVEQRREARVPDLFPP
jgi:hypothetical protein